MNPLKRPGSDNFPEAKRSFWQQPASCKFCRTKKIRCDKRRPCSSCTARGVTCEYDSIVEDRTLAQIEPSGGHMQHTPTIRSLEKWDPQLLVSNRADYNRGMHEMNERLKRMEQLLHRISQPQSVSDSSSQSADLHPRVDSSNEKGPKTWDHLESIAASPHIENSSPNYISSNPAAPIENILTPAGAERLIDMLPDIHTARTLFEHYVEAIDCLDRVIHVPYTRTVLEATYTELQFSPSPPPHETILFLICIFASASFYLCRKHCQGMSIQLDRAHVKSLSLRERAIQEVMQQDAMYSSSIVSLQSGLIILFLVWDSEGQSKRYYTLKSTIHAKAMQMGLHKLDSDHNDEMKINYIETEIKRRLWWHLVCTDWLVGGVAGPQEGTYTINRSQIATKYPANIDDEDLTTDTPPKAHPISQPTSMSFFLQRIEVASICRESIDLLQSIQKHTSDPPYHTIIQISERYTSLLDSLPRFFQLETSSKADSPAERPYIPRQRIILLYGLYSRLGRLHRPFLTRGITDKTFELSHRIGIECAWKILDLRKIMADEDICTFKRSYSVDQHSFSALLLLSIDTIARSGRSGVESQRSEIMDACKALMGKYQSPGRPESGIGRAVELLLDMLQRSKQPENARVSDSLGSPAQSLTPFISREFSGSEDRGVGESTVAANLSNQVSWMDGLSFPELPGQEINDLFDELRTTVPNPSFFSWEDFLNC